MTAVGYKADLTEVVIKYQFTLLQQANNAKPLLLIGQSTSPVTSMALSNCLISVSPTLTAKNMVVRIISELELRLVEEKITLGSFESSVSTYRMSNRKFMHQYKYEHFFSPNTFFTVASMDEDFKIYMDQVI